MNQISMREAQINLAKYIEDLPIEITRFGKVVARVVQPNEDNIYDNSNSEELKKESNDQTSKIKQIVDNLKPLAPPVETIIELDKQIEETWGSDKLSCHFCRSKPAQMMSYKYDDGSGEGETYFCKACYDKYESRQEIKPDYSYGMFGKQSDMTYFRPIPKPVKKKK